MIDFSATVLTAGVNAFGQPATYIPFKYAQFTVSGVFDEAYCEEKWLESQLITVTMPVFGVKLVDFPNLPLQNDHLIINLKAYIVREVRVDGHGGATLMLNLDSEYVWH